MTNSGGVDRRQTAQGLAPGDHPEQPTQPPQSEEAVRENERILRAILQTAADGICVIDPRRRRIVDVNAAYCEMSGYARDEVIGMDVGDLDALENPDETRARIERVIAEGASFFETRHRRKDGSLFPVEVSASRVEEIGGLLVCFCRDVSEQRASQERIGLLNQMVDAAPASVLVHDDRGRVLFANAFTAALHGYEDEQEFLKVNLHELDVPESASLLEERFRLLTDGKPARFEVAHYRKDGSSFPLEILARSITWEGRPVILSIGSDITERKRAESELRLSQQRYQALFDKSADGIFLHDLEGTILDVNEEALRQSGYTKEELLGTNVLALLADPGLRAEPPGIWRTWQPGESFRIENEQRRKDGRAYPVEIKTGKILLAGTEVMLAIVRDLTESRKLEEQFRQSQKMEAVGRLAGGIAHDFNNMLNVILGYTELGLRELTQADPLQADLLEIQKAAERSAELTRQLLAFARRQTLEFKVVDLNELVGSLLKMLGRLIREDVDLLWKPGEDLATVRMDPTQLDQILANLVVNAGDAIGDKPGKITIETSQVDLDAAYCAAHPGFFPGSYVVLEVSDDGCGMNAETRSMAFEPFFTTKEPGKGTGLGLSTVYGIVKQNDGFIHVYSEPGVGTTFRIYLTAHSAAAREQAPVVAPAPARGHETILLVEDEHTILALGARMLETLGYRTLVASGPREALALAEAYDGEIHLLVTDVVMPEMNGRDLAEQMLKYYPSLKRLFISGYTANVIVHHGVLEGGVNFLQKPFSLDGLGQKVREALET